MKQGKSSRRGHARADRIARRRLPPEYDPCPPGQLGGAYKPLTDEQLRAIYEMALRCRAAQHRIGNPFAKPDSWCAAHIIDLPPR